MSRSDVPHVHGGMRRAQLGWWLAAGWLVACGGATGPVRQGQEAPAQEPATVEEAEAQLEGARAALRELMPDSFTGSAPRKAAERPSTPSGAAPPPEPAPPAATGTADSAPGADRAEKRSRADEAEPPDPCVRACQAFGSLSRAVAAVCRLAGEDSERCRRARAVEREESARVARCACRGR